MSCFPDIPQMANRSLVSGTWNWTL